VGQRTAKGLVRRGAGAEPFGKEVDKAMLAGVGDGLGLDVGEIAFAAFESEPQAVGHPEDVEIPEGI